MALEDILKPLQEIDGYQAATIFDIKGQAVVKHNETEYIDVNASSILNAIKCINTSGLGKCHFVQINFTKGILCASWLVEGESFVIALLELKGNVGLAKLALAQMVEIAKKEKLNSFFQA